uniref:HD domain-containing protein n=1 Tax=Thalassobacillus sp. C254 TaxID=1225341 RepID=UPI0018DD4100
MEEYTLHDVDHLSRVLRHMDSLIPEETLNHLSPLELGLLILTAFFHDLGMAPTGKEMEIYQGLKDDLTEKDWELDKEFKIYCKSNPNLQRKIDELLKINYITQAE